MLTYYLKLQTSLNEQVHSKCTGIKSVTLMCSHVLKQGLVAPSNENAVIMATMPTPLAVKLCYKYSEAHPLCELFLIHTTEYHQSNQPTPSYVLMSST